TAGWSAPAAGSCRWWAWARTSAQHGSGRTGQSAGSPWRAATTAPTSPRPPPRGRSGSRQQWTDVPHSYAGPPPELPGHLLLYSGKVRDLYAPLDPQTGLVDESRLLLVASDRISAYDFVLDTPVPDKGAVLTQLS